MRIRRSIPWRCAPCCRSRRRCGRRTCFLLSTDGSKHTQGTDTRMQPTSAVHAGEILLFFTLLQLCVIVLAGRVGGAVAKSVGQATAVGEIVIGILLGPSLFG